MSGDALVASLAGDDEIAAQFSATAEIAAMLRFEAVLAEAQGALGIIPDDAARAIAEAASRVVADKVAIRRGMARDGVPVPALVMELRAACGEAQGGFVHHGATSQDVVDSGSMLRLKMVLSLINDRVARVLGRLADMAADQAATPLMAQTRMQAALPFTAAEKLATWRVPLESHRGRLARLAAELPVQLGGPIGNGASFGPDYPALRADLARRLGLREAQPWHADRTPVLDVAHGLALLTGSLAKIGQDVALMAQTRVQAIELTGGGESSAMAHKRNPVAAEALVALGRLNAGLLGTLAQSMIHENERSGAAWTLEWLVLPQMAEAAGGACRLAEALLADARFVPEPDAGR
ncbi:3-carboxy-cis,cis-muconate cycloisomerase [Antarcticirhabdus aurantiaca]|uniref:3-carboxy-cis,cis-muconate cycloisomerase n=1 Tax=Antarcticirhabdus aurantiaca TaxID=2606717 RepID=A0ACD4NQ74_9HYPH|nr:3-carboxy-cis,cis-muconate cycloisomerase [Antarcticirhabdus aurantiaca]WAJ28903.1 3-carboxy-cis,cis-muconate cycloisomerase [Jeongeuplla avenae]